MFKIHVPFELKCPKREKNEVVLCDDGGEKKRKKSFIVTHAVVTALGSAHCNCLCAGKGNSSRNRFTTE